MVKEYVCGLPGIPATTVSNVPGPVNVLVKPLAVEGRRTVLQPLSEKLKLTITGGP